MVDTLADPLQARALAVANSADHDLKQKEKNHHIEKEMTALGNK